MKNDDTIYNGLNNNKIRHYRRNKRKIRRFNKKKRNNRLYCIRCGCKIYDTKHKHLCSDCHGKGFHKFVD